MPRTAVFDLCAAALQAVVAGWPDPSDAPALPDRQYVTNGDVMWDCEQLVVQAESTYPTQGDPRVQNYWADDAVLGMRGLVFAVWLIRCVPDIDAQGSEVILPSATAMQDSARDLLGDADSILGILVDAQRAGELAGCNDLTFDGWTPVGPSGGLGGGVSRWRCGVVPSGVE